MYSFGSIVLTRFPFTDLSGSKVRPALVISRNNASRADIVLAFITSQLPVSGPDALEIEPSPANGLKVKSAVRFDKVATLETGIVVGKLGDAEAPFLKTAAFVFHGVFGFSAP